METNIHNRYHDINKLARYTYTPNSIIKFVEDKVYLDGQESLFLKVHPEEQEYVDYFTDMDAPNAVERFGKDLTDINNGLISGSLLNIVISYCLAFHGYKKQHCAFVLYDINEVNNFLAMATYLKVYGRNMSINKRTDPKNSYSIDDTTNNNRGGVYVQDLSSSNSPNFIIDAKFKNVFVSSLVPHVFIKVLINNLKDSRIIKIDNFRHHDFTVK